MSHSRRLEPPRSDRESAAADRREPSRLSPAVVTLVRHRIATGFYDSAPVKRAIALGVLADGPAWPRGEKSWR